MSAAAGRSTDIDTIETIISGLGATLLEMAGDRALLYQLLIVAIALPAAWLLKRRYAPRFEARIRAMEEPNQRTLRVLAVLLRRLEWVFFSMLAALALLAARISGWPGSDYLISTALLLALAWLAIALLSRVIRNRTASRWVAVGVWTWVALRLLRIDDDVARLLDAVGFTVGSVNLSVLLVIKALALLAVLVWLAIVVANFAERRLGSSDDLSPSLRVLIGKVVKITLVAGAFLFSLSALGIDLTVFAVFSGAIGVGIGFGLQKVVSNFISGIIILLDRSIKPGDTITLGETFGWIRELRARFVSVVTRDGREYLIPNEDFITHEVINWSFSDELVRLDVAFGVSYDSDPHEVSRLAVEAASGCDRVFGGRPPVCWMTEFGDSSLNFLLRFWIRDPQGGLTNVRGKVLLALWDTFKANDIKIPYPHRELIFKDSGPPPGAVGATAGAAPNGESG